ncbi:uncharacterized protein N0V89_008141 [Didymosphaeria variabile]|uniref:Gfd2/YDR514C-like C-terminal domain-containing protein n=1 Tax=Didymosphaeria variabile TaxID=1932322 RepID=A0A9W8XFR1_9PLEO|nr:uncharacterized protein N0V89_008141 [Didymosphaeria variabile]KAJ4349525.1 hypothetical protein N0V89_008141 [Didymosphaeria variabile]
MTSSPSTSPNDSLYADNEYDMVDREAMAEVKLFFSALTHAESLQFCLGIEDTTDARFSKIPALAYLTTVICFDTEGWNADSSKLTEVGFNRFSAQSARSVKPGPWGENILHNASFYHARIAENSHLESRTGTQGDPTSNRFGRTRFLSIQEARIALEEFFAVRTADGQGICPVVILGHALGGDTVKLWKLLGLDPNRLGNVVKEVDTQQIVRDLGYWRSRDQVGLQRIIHELGFEYRDAHTASNDAAMTLIAAVLLVLPNNGYSEEKGVQEVVDGIERLSQGDAWDHGSDKYCQHCHSRDHFAENGGRCGGRCKVPVHCDHCAALGRRQAASSHMTEDCVSFALENGNSKKAKANRESKREAGRERKILKNEEHVVDKIVQEHVPRGTTGIHQSSKGGWASHRRRTATHILWNPAKLLLPLAKHTNAHKSESSQAGDSTSQISLVTNTKSPAGSSPEMNAPSPAISEGFDRSLSLWPPAQHPASKDQPHLYDRRRANKRSPSGHSSNRFATANTFEALVGIDKEADDEDDQFIYKRDA